MGAVVLSIVVLQVVLPPVVAFCLMLKGDPRKERQDFASVGDSKQWVVGDFVKLQGPLGDFVRLWAAEPTPAERIDLICERVGDIDAATNNVREICVAIARGGIAAGGFTCVVMVSAGIRDRRAELVWCGIAAMVAAAISALLCHWMGRRAHRGITSRRRAWDSLLGLLMRPYDTLEAVATDDFRAQSVALEQKLEQKFVQRVGDGRRRRAERRFARRG